MHHVANVEVTSSNLVTRSNICKIFKELPFVEMKDIILTITHLPFIFILIYIFSSFFLKKKFFKKIIFFNTFLIILFLLPITSYLLKNPLYPKKNIYEENINIVYSIILVPTGGIFYHEEKKKVLPSNQSIKRFKKALKFSNNLNIPIIISGGKTKKNFDSEAEILQKYIKESFKKNLILEKDSINSYETSVNIEKYINENKISNNIILITDLYHFKRMSGSLKNKNIISYFPKELFQRKKINYKDFIPTYRNFAKINKIKYEYLGIIYYLMSNKMNFKDLFN